MKKHFQYFGVFHSISANDKRLCVSAVIEKLMLIKLQNLI
jgi:hypothetical protein